MGEGVGVCLYICMDVWVCGCVGVWVCGCVGVWVCGCVCVWVCGCVGMVTGEFIDICSLSPLCIFLFLFFSFLIRKWWSYGFLCL